MLAHRINGLANAVFVGLVLSNVLLFYLWWEFQRRVSWIQLTDHARDYAIVYATAVLLGFFYASKRIFQNRYRLTTLNFVQCFALAFRIVLGFGLGAFFIYFLLKDIHINRSFLFVYACISFPFNIFILKTLPNVLVKYFYPDHDKTDAVLIGNGQLPKSLSRFLQDCDRLGIRFVGYYSNEEDNHYHYKYMGSIEDFLSSQRGPYPDRVLAYNMDYREEGFHSLVKFCHDEGIRLQAYADVANVFDEPLKLVTEGELNFLVFMNEPLEDPINRTVKRIIDLLISIPVVLCVLPPLFFIVWFMQMRQSPGPILFRQQRYGLGRKPFQIYKFRSMHYHTDHDAAQVKQATRNDVRTFAFGRFLRKTSLDEFPQFLNVLKGEMSVVGPRPHPMQLDERFEKAFYSYRSRHFVKPGITGYAQIHALRGEITSPELLTERINKDLHYIKNWSLYMECSILWKTLWQVINPPKSAY